MTVFGLLLFAAFLPLAPPAETPATFATVGGEIVARVRDEFFDGDRGREWARRHAELGAGVSDSKAFAQAVRTALDELAASHTGYYRHDDPDYWDLLAIFEPTLGRDPTVERIGAAFVSIDGQWFVERTFPGGPAERAGLLRGDRVTTAGGSPFHPQESLRGNEGWPLALGVERHPGGPEESVTVSPRRLDPREEWRAAQRDTARILDLGDRRIGEVRLFSCAGEEPTKVLGEQLQGELATAEALVVDLRGGWGGCDFRFVALFDPAVPTLTARDREGSEVSFSAAWRKPLVLLIDGGSRSGKEAVARALQRSGRAHLVGSRTAGAVVAGQPFLLSDGSLLYLAVRDVWVDGEHLEGVGVRPDLEVAAPLPFAAGADPAFDAARELAARLAREAAGLKATER